MASAKQNQDFNAWVQMMSMQGQNVPAPVGAQLFSQSTPEPIGGMSLPPDQQQVEPEIGGMSMPPPPPPKPVPVEAVNPRRTTQPTTDPLGTTPAELIPGQMGPRPMKNLSLVEEIELSSRNLGKGQQLQQDEVNQMKRRLAEYMGQERGIDFAPLAALLDTWYGGKLTEGAKAVAPESAAQKKKTIYEMQKQIADAQAKMTGEEREAMKERLSQLGYEQQRKTALDVARINAGARRTNELLDQREEARREKQTIDYAETIGKQSTTLYNNVKNLESKLGFKLDSIDPETGRVNGKKVDIPGVSIPIAGRINWSDSAADLQSRFAPIFNTVLKDRSGAAVTNPELERLKNEFAQGRFNTEESMLAAVRRFRDVSAEVLKSIESGYVPEVKERYKGQGGKTVDDLFPGGGLSGSPVDDANADLSKMSAEELQRWIDKHGGQ